MPRAVSDTSRVQQVGHYLVTEVPIGKLEDSAAAVRQHLIGRTYDDASHVFVTAEDGRFEGIISLGTLMSAEAQKPLSALIKPAERHVVTPETDREDAASLAIQTGISTLAVCDADRRFLGALSASAMMSILRDEHLEDLHHMAGILGKSEKAQAALTAPPYRRALYRLPWLLVGMGGSAVATATMARFEGVLAAHIAVAFLIPAVVYLADAVGTQSEAVAVRGLSLMGGDLIPLLFGELGTGILIGAALGGLAFPLIWIMFASATLAATVSLALIAASSIATTIGLLLPWSFARIGYDPALSSGPLATVIQDVISLLVYFLIASRVVV
ncbi:MAG: magnesium transporter [Pseudorhodoplanes sp.]|jgi:magnesium transporter|nr:magnesium transporter [Pseudorhodoplanes sp.]